MNMKGGSLGYPLTIPSKLKQFEMFEQLKRIGKQDEHQNFM